MMISTSVGLVSKRNMTEKLCHPTIKLANIQKSVLYLTYFKVESQLSRLFQFSIRPNEAAVAAFMWRTL